MLTWKAKSKERVSEVVEEASDAVQKHCLLWKVEVFVSNVELGSSQYNQLGRRYCIEVESLEV